MKLKIIMGLESSSPSKYAREIPVFPAEESFALGFPLALFLFSTPPSHYGC
jgi:hypothetical protein